MKDFYPMKKKGQVAIEKNGDRRRKEGVLKLVGGTSVTAQARMPGKGSRIGNKKGVLPRS